MQIDTLPMISLMSDVVRLRFEDVGVDFPTAAGPMRVVDGVDLEVRQGEFVSIIGPSGCGKTTLLNIVGGFVKPTRGQVLLDHEPVKGPGPDRGVIFQEYGVFPWLTVRGNIEFGLGLRANGRARRAARRDRRALPGADGPEGFRQPPSQAPLGRHAPAPRARPRLRGPARVPAHGRAVRRARRADAHRHAGPAAAGARQRGQDRAARHPLGRRGDLPVVADRRRHGAAGAGARRSSTCRSRIRARSRCTRTIDSPSCARASAPW